MSENENNHYQFFKLSEYEFTMPDVVPGVLCIDRM